MVSKTQWRAAVEYGPRSAVRAVAVMGMVAALACGCTSGARQIIASPLSVAEQQRAILDLAPLGTSRDEVDRRLREAGVRTSAGYNDSIVYCLMWERPDGERWHIDVALLFDDAGKLYRARSSDAESAGIGSAMPAARVPTQSPGWRPGASSGGVDRSNALDADEERPRVPFIGKDGDGRR